MRDAFILGGHENNDQDGRDTLELGARSRRHGFWESCFFAFDYSLWQPLSKSQQITEKEK